MRQAIHIFRKDARRCWPYIAAVLALTALNAWLACRDALRGRAGAEQLALSLMSLARWFAVAAVVQGERLVGERQFWVTRPYSWKSLLGAKLLFLGVFVGLPVLVSDCVILYADAFNPFALIPGMILRQCWLAGVLALPFVLAALTTTIYDFALAGLAFFLCYFLEGFPFALWIGRMPLGPTWILDGMQWLLPVAGISLAAWQYARRQTARVRVAALVLAGFAPLWTFPALDVRNGLRVPSVPRNQNVTIQFDPGRGHTRAGGIPGLFYIPVKISGWSEDLVECQPLGDATYRGGLYCVTSAPDGGAWLGFDPVRWLPAEGHLSLFMELDLYEEQPSVNLPPDGGWVLVPGFGCVRQREDANGEVIVARTALKPAGPQWTFRLSQGGGGSWNYLPTDNATKNPTPMSFRAGSVCLKESKVYPKGTLTHPVRFTARRLAGVIQRELKIANIRLADYQCKEP